MSSAQLPGNDAVTGMLAFLDGRPADAVLSWRQASVQSPEDAPYLEAWIARAGSPESGAVSAQRGSR